MATYFAAARAMLQPRTGCDQRLGTRLMRKPFMSHLQRERERERGREGKRGGEREREGEREYRAPSQTLTWKPTGSS